MASTTLIPSTSFGSANGEYDGVATLWFSIKTKGDGYLGRTDGVHTIAYFPDSFIGTLGMQGSLVTDPQAADWFDIPNTTVGNGATPTSLAATFNFTGNYVWLRVKVDQFTAGAIIRVQFNH